MRSCVMPKKGRRARVMEAILSCAWLLSDDVMDEAVGDTGAIGNALRRES